MRAGTDQRVRLHMLVRTGPHGHLAVTRCTAGCAFTSIRQNKLGTHVLDDTPYPTEILSAAFVEGNHVPVPTCSYRRHQADAAPVAAPPPPKDEGRRVRVFL